MPEVGIEPTRFKGRRILNPLRLPIPPLRHRMAPLYRLKLTLSKLNFYDFRFNRYTAKPAKMTVANEAPTIGGTPYTMENGATI